MTSKWQWQSRSHKATVRHKENKKAKVKPKCGKRCQLSSAQLSMDVVGIAKVLYFPQLHLHIYMPAAVWCENFCTPFCVQQQWGQADIYYRCMFFFSHCSRSFATTNFYMTSGTALCFTLPQVISSLFSFCCNFTFFILSYGFKYVIMTLALHLYLNLMPVISADMPINRQIMRVIW